MARAVFRGYDREALDREYDNRAKVKDAAEPLTVGALEGPEYLRQSHELARVWRSHGLRAEVVEMAGHHHFSIVAELENPASELSRRLAEQIALA
jgi:hypothetical protein